MNFIRLYEFLELFNLEKKFKRRETMTGRNWPKASRARPSPAAKLAQGARGGAVARSPSAWRWPDDCAVFTGDLSAVWGRRRAR
jgi:hypothetical protein